MLIQNYDLCTQLCLMRKQKSWILFISFIRWCCDKIFFSFILCGSYEKNDDVYWIWSTPDRSIEIECSFRQFFAEISLKWKILQNPICIVIRLSLQMITITISSSNCNCCLLLCFGNYESRSWCKSEWN